MNRFSNSRTASSNWTSLSTISSTSRSNRSLITARGAPTMLYAPGPHPRRCCSAAARLATAQGCRPGTSFEFSARQPSKRLYVLRARPGDDLVGQRRHGRLLVPADLFEVVANELFVEARLCAPRTIAVLRPES